MANALNIDLEGKVVVMKVSVMAPEFKDIQWRLQRVTGGFGMRAFTSGRALICESVADGVSARWDATSDVERLATDAEVAAVTRSEG